MEYITRTCCNPSGLPGYKVSGDDSIFFYDTLDMSCLSRRAKYYFGMTLNFPKQFIFDKNVHKGHFLGSVFTLKGPERELKKMALGCMMTTDK